jgi:agmatine deiminase
MTILNRSAMISRRKFTALAASAMATGVAKAKTENVSAKAAGFSMPLETAPHVRTFMQWPSSLEIYGTQTRLNGVQNRIALIANSIAKFEPVIMLAAEKQIKIAQPNMHANIEFWPIETQDLWCRDSGPTFVKNAEGKTAISELNFNGWGNKQDHEHDAKIAMRVAEKLAMDVFNSGAVGEGGGVETDGDGTLLAHASCWVNSNRNSDSENQIASKLLKALGAEKMIWAPGVIGADITDYHIDALARFVRPGLVLIQLPNKIDESDPWSVAAYETYSILKKSTDAKGRKLEIVVLPDPVNIRSRNPDFVSSYVNYYVCNGGVISAEFGDDKADEIARKTLSQLYSNRDVISLNIDPIGEVGGGIHCSTQQQPA